VSDLHRALKLVMEGRTLSREEARLAVEEMLVEGFSAVRAAALVAAMARRGEEAEEVAGFVDALRSRAARVPVSGELAARSVDVCGTGGDGQGTFNVSTTAAFVVAGAGVPVAKHGGRAVSSASGSADVLAALGVRIDMPPPVAARALLEANVTFLFAPAYHPAMKSVGPMRRELGVRTAFNLAGPLANPLGVKRQLVGVDRPLRVPVVAHALAALGAKHALVVSNSGAGDELLPHGLTIVAEVSEGEVRLEEWTAATFGLPERDPRDMAGGDAETNAVILRAVLSGEIGPRRDAVLMNAAAALVVSGVALDLGDGVSRAAVSIDSGAALRALEALAVISQEVA
jgi:anthranilate phosphoribosyltransferase